MFFGYLLIGLSLLTDVIASANSPATLNFIQTNNAQPHGTLPKKKTQKNIYVIFQGTYKRFKQKLRGIVKNKAKRIALATSAAISATGVALSRFFSRAPAAVSVQAEVDGAAQEDEEKQGNSMDTELHLAVREKRNDHSVQLLLNNKASVHAKEDNGNLPLHYAMRAECYADIRLLLQHKANINIQNDRGLTPLHLATPIYADDKIASLLLDAMPQLEVTNNNGLTALQLGSIYI